MTRTAEPLATTGARAGLKLYGIPVVPVVGALVAIVNFAALLLVMG